MSTAKPCNKWLLRLKSEAMKTLNFIWIMLIVTSSCNKNTAEIIERTIMPVSADEEVRGRCGNIP